ncbi:translation initiation factor IF-2 [Candidatus Dojkabacteria bacterium]|uniref:Translation initiation factor IF-2 n=1 Tax=Candidatus Dojkabacteria bacterium TaxID=2099670 RepID=A0A955L9L5_9BACT|nr:translation initiation factor IF-2 [Candidatus Dojkabacteria bacterium]
MPNKSENKNVRQPIVAVMGHVDHGKTTFLDSIRGARVADKEFGGITQNTRAHEVTTKSGFKITFIDTPGHEAFSSMRERGARVTDFVLLMVAADDGVQPQTKESIEFAHQNNVPIIVAINKVDLEGVQLQKIKQELASYKVNIEEYGGDVMCFEISAKNKVGLDELLEGIELMAEVNELKPHTPKEGVIAEAFVMESSLDKHIGYGALAILKSGELKDRFVGVTKDSIFKVRAYLNEDGKPVQTVSESQPFTVIGLKDDLPTGEIINFVKDEKEAKKLQDDLKSGVITEDEPQEVEMNAESLFAQLLMQKEEKAQGLEQQELNIVLRCSTQGTLEAVEAELKKLATEESKVTVVQKGTGPISEDDLNMAKVAKAIVISFQVDVPNAIMTNARRNKVLVRHYEIIYELIDEIADVLDSMDQPQEEIVDMATAEVLQVFTLSNGDQVAGCRVTDGKFVKGYKIRAERGETELGEAKVTSIRQGKNEVKEMKKGNECGLLLNPGIADLQEGDKVIAFRVEKY